MSGTIKHPDLFGTIHDTMKTEGEHNMSKLDPVQGELDVDGKREAWGSARTTNCPLCGVGLDRDALKEHQEICAGLTLTMTMPPASKLFPRK